MSHTKGPWFYKKEHDEGGDYIIYGSDEFVALSIGGTQREEGNANLIAAAPELLVSLEQVLWKIENSDYWWMDLPDRGGFDAEKIRAAIAKAKGELK